MRFNTKYIVVLITVFLASPLFSQNNGLDKDAWEGTIEGTDFFEKRQSLKPVEDSDSNKPIDDASSANKSKNNNREDFSDKSSSSFNIPSSVSYLLMALIIGLLLYFIVYTIIKNPAVNTEKNISYLTDDDINEIEENLFENDLEKYIFQAKKAGNYKLAIRFSFVYIIRLLAENESIKWRKQKTNYDYLNELEGHSFKESFNYCRVVFENLWYGKIEFQESSLIQTLELYSSHISSLKVENKTA